MKPHWDKLTEQFKDSKTALIADVDCTAGGKSLCEKVGVTGYPTIKYGDPNDLKDYNGGRDVSALTKFAEENLGPTCGPDNLDLCNDDQKALISKFQKMDPDELAEKAEEVDAKLKNFEAESKKAVEKLEKKISELQGKIKKENEKKDATLDKEKKMDPDELAENAEAVNAKFKNIEAESKKAVEKLETKISEFQGRIAVQKKRKSQSFKKALIMMNAVAAVQKKKDEL